MKVNLQAKNLKNYVQYTNPTKQIKINKEKIDTNNQLFHQMIPKKKVKKRIYKLKNIVKIVTISASTFLVGMNVSAESTVNTMKNLPSQEELLRITQWAIEYAGTAIIYAGIVWIIVTRVLNFIPVEKYRKLALQIATNTISGITETLMIPTLIGIIIGVAYLLFGHISTFKLPL